jgi:arginyl-tRNA--protein-N-Asp/Glu arginylyltransferase
MIQDFRFPLQMLPEELDNYLSGGWYRMSQCIFTTDYVELNGQDYKAIWLRIDLKTYQPSSTIEKLEKRNKNFQTEIVPFNYSSHYEAVYEKYISSVKGDRSKSLADFLFDFTNNDIFNSLAIHLYDHKNLVGAGIFDIGNKSAAGICSFFDPAYRKYSVGRYLIYKKIEYCRQNGFDYFYPGYFVPGIKTFDYKLKIGTGALEFFNMQKKEWKNIRFYKPEDKAFIV